jgi:hypothetical protein
LNTQRPARWRATGQAQRSTVYTPLPEPKVISGADLGFRLEGVAGDKPAGTLGIRVNGEWVAPTASPHMSVRPATQ